VVVLGPVVLEPPLLVVLGPVVVLVLPPEPVVVVPPIQAPAEQVCPAVQALPHAPQLAKLDCVSTHIPLHEVWPATEQLQAPALQVCPAPQVVPHMPQFWTSVVTLTQAFPQAVSPAAQVAAHAPRLQKGRSAAQAVAHVPQLVGSELVSTHTLLQLMRPAWQLQVPPRQSCPTEQAVPQAPHAVGSDDRSRQSPFPQSCRPAPHIGMGKGFPVLFAPLPLPPLVLLERPAGWLQLAAKANTVPSENKVMISLERDRGR
jgi:hypothetical protein